jgi:tetratricopeptide (TPR) repeat protein
MKGITISALLLALSFTGAINCSAADEAAKPQTAQKNISSAASYISPINAALKAVKLNPTPQNYLNLSMVYYSNGLFEECVSAADQAIKLKPAYAEAYNNAGAAYNSMGMWDEAITALNQSLSINPGFQLAKNNLAAAKNAKASSKTSIPYVSPVKAAVKTAKLTPTPQNYLDLSLVYYTHGLFSESVSAANQAILLKPAYAEAYNNAGAAYNTMKMWDKAITALNKAVSINPGFQLAQNNLAIAKAGKAATVRK